MFATMPSALPLVKADQLKALAVTSLGRSPAIPEIPAVAESLPGFEATAWWGIVVPRNTERRIVERLNREIATILGREESRQRLASEGAEPKPTNPEGFGSYIQSEKKKWARVIELSGVKAD